MNNIIASDLYHELDHAIIACRNSKYSDEEYYPKNYLDGVEDGLKGFRRFIRSQEFYRLSRKRRNINVR